MGGAHRLDAHAYDCRVVAGADGVRIIRFRVVASPRLDADQIRTLASLRKPRVAPVARVALGCVAVMAAAVAVVAGGRIVVTADQLPGTTVVTAAQLPLRAFVGPIATLDPAVPVPAPVVHVSRRVRPVVRVQPTVTPTVPDVPVKHGKHAKGNGS